MPDEGIGLRVYPLSPTHEDGSPNHLRFGEISGENNMNYTADATFANVWTGDHLRDEEFIHLSLDDYEAGFLGASGPAARGRYLKEDGAKFLPSPLPLPAGLRAIRATWTEIPADLWFDEGGDGWLEALRNDRDGNGRRDVRIELEIWDDRGTVPPGDDVRVAAFTDPAGANAIPPLQGRLYYKALFVNEWDAATRANHPLDVTPYLDDVTLTFLHAGGPRILGWEEGG